MKQFNINFVISSFKYLVMLLILTLTVTSCDDKTDEMGVDGSTAPAFTLTSSDGTAVSLSSYSNKVVVLFFFGNNCPSCKASAPDFQTKLVTAFANRSDYAAIGIDQWNGNLASVQAFKSTTGLTIPLLLNGAATASAYKTTYDRIVIIDQSGKVVYTGNANVSSDIETVKLKVEALLGIDNTVPAVLDNAPAFSLSSLEGNEVKLSDYQNKVVVLFFFGYGCPPCKAAAPSIESTLVTPYASRTDYKLIGVDQWNGNVAAVQAFKSATNVTFTLLLQGATVASSYKTTYDRFVIIDKSGKIAFTGTQGVSSDLSIVKQKVDQLFAN